MNRGAFVDASNCRRTRTRTDTQTYGKLEEALAALTPLEVEGLFFLVPDGDVAVRAHVLILRWDFASLAVM